MNTTTRNPRLSSLTAGRGRKFALGLLVAFALAAPAQAFAQCISTVTIYRVLGYEVWRTEEMTCAK